MRIQLNVLFLIILFLSCSEGEIKRTKVEDTSQIKIFEEISSAQSGIDFNNLLTETPELNSITHDGMLNGAGVAILDYDNDGLQDIYFASNMGSDKLYRNKGNFKFEDVTEKAGLKSKNWSTGVAVVDINKDGYDDIYVCKFMHEDQNKRANLFYINKGDGTFVERAEALGVADRGYSIMANFLDYDRDGDLDLYLANQPPNSLKLKGMIKGQVMVIFTDKLFRNDNGKFTDVTKESGIENYSYSLSATTVDFNKDGWPDIYVACDYDEADYFYKNNGNGTFTNVVLSSLKHISNFSMGVDVADINNDGHSDIFVADMVAEDNFRQKTNMSGMNPEKFYGIAEAGHHYQYMFNSMQLNNGDGSFSEIAQLSGISNTDWSWTPLFIDADQDGYKDLLVTNGIFKEMRNQDYTIWRKKFYAEKLAQAENTAEKHLNINPMDIANRAESVKITNYIYQNNGDLTFSKRSSNWGLDKKTWSQGAAYADFDNDGDLDLVMNNMQMTAGLYKNTANEKGLNNYINVELEETKNTRTNINAQIEVTVGGQTQIYEYTPYRGYMSTSQRLAHFGLGEHETIDELKVIWADNKMIRKKGIKANQTLKLNYSEAQETYRRTGLQRNSLFKPMKSIDVAHEENQYNDFIREILLPYRTSTLGPIICEGDVNGDGLADIFVGGSFGKTSKLLINRGSGSFQQSNGLPQEINYEDGGAAFIDVDNDKDLDLYVSGGGNEFKPQNANYLDRLYINNGSGQFTRSNAIPELATSNSVVVPLDYDKDGDLDLFVGGRQVPGKYGWPTNSYILQNDKGSFTDVSKTVAPMFNKLGMVTDAKLADLDGDGNDELVIVGEWMKVGVYKVGNTLEDMSQQYGLGETNGWWNTVEVYDVNGDNKLDLVAGNLGYNIKYKASASEPFKVYTDDFDGNGSHDVYLGYYENGKCYPVRGRQCSSEQMPFVKEKFGSYREFGLATIDQVLEGKVASTTVVNQAHTFANTVFLNEGSSFKSVVLPNEAQIAPVYGIAIDDFDKDGTTDIFLAGNMYQREVETTRSDAGKGVMLTFLKDGTISTKRSTETGVSADRDVRAVKTIASGDTNLLVIANNNSPMQFYSY